MMHIAIGLLLLFVAFLAVLYFMKTIVWELLKLTVIVAVIAVTLYFIPVDWSQFSNEDNYKPLKDLYSKTLSCIKNDDEIR